MSCSYHKDRNAVYSCSHCGKWLCESCSIELDSGQIVCKNCISEMAKNSAGNPHYRMDYSEIKSSKNHVSSFLCFIFSMLPGGGHMYIGLIKRGLLILTLFFASIYVCAILDIGMFLGFSLPIIWIAQFFDAIRLRRLVNRGGMVEDSISDIIRVFKNYGVYIAIFMLLGIFSNYFRFGIFSFRAIITVAAIALIAFGISKTSANIRVKTASNPGNNDEDSYIDKR